MSKMASQTGTLAPSLGTIGLISFVRAIESAIGNMRTGLSQHPVERDVNDLIMAFVLIIAVLGGAAIDSNNIVFGLFLAFVAAFLLVLSQLNRGEN